MTAATGALRDRWRRRQRPRLPSLLPGWSLAVTASAGWSQMVAAAVDGRSAKASDFALFGVLAASELVRGWPHSGPRLLELLPPEYVYLVAYVGGVVLAAAVWAIGHAAAAHDPDTAKNAAAVALILVALGLGFVDSVWRAWPTRGGR